MQAIHNAVAPVYPSWALFQRAKIQDKCKQFTTEKLTVYLGHELFQRAKIQDKCKQFTTMTYP